MYCHESQAPSQSLAQGAGLIRAGPVVKHHSYFIFQPKTSHRLHGDSVSLKLVHVQLRFIRTIISRGEKFKS